MLTTDETKPVQGDDIATPALLIRYRDRGAVDSSVTLTIGEDYMFVCEGWLLGHNGMEYEGTLTTTADLTPSAQIGYFGITKEFKEDLDELASLWRNKREGYAAKYRHVIALLRERYYLRAMERRHGYDTSKYR